VIDSARLRARDVDFDEDAPFPGTDPRLAVEVLMLPTELLRHQAELLEGHLDLLASRRHRRLTYLRSACSKQVDDGPAVESSQDLDTARAASVLVPDAREVRLPLGIAAVLEERVADHAH
jgi:hypothetical protein